MAHVQSSQLQASHWESGVLGALGGQRPRAGSTSKALAPVRGALLGSALGLGCWALFGMLAWVIF